MCDTSMKRKSLTVFLSGRIMLIDLATKLEQHHWITCYFDTDSSLAVPVVPNPTPLKDFLLLGKRLGALKIELDNVVYLVATNAKTYMLVLSNGQVIVKAKGFSSINHLLRKAGKPEALRSLLFDNLVPPAEYDACQGNKSSLSIFQKRIPISRETLVPCKVDDPVMKKLNMVGYKSEIKSP